MRFFRRQRVLEHRPDPSPAIALEPIGYVRNDVAKPRPHGWSRIESTIELLAPFEPMLSGLDGYSHIIVVFFMDLAADAPEKPRSLTLASGNEYGILATRSQLRPNHLGVSVVPLLRVEGNRLVVRGLDAIDATPVLDVKPYLPHYDSFPDATIPEA